MTLHYQESDPILVGSGELYIGVVNDPENTDETTIKAALKNIGVIQAGATLTYSNDIKEIESGNRGIIMSFITKQRIEFDCGIMTWVFDNLELLCPGTVETNVETGTKKIKIGAKKTLPVNYLRFIHEKSDGNGELIINMYRATPNSGFALTFDKEEPLSVGYKFTGLATNSGNMCEIIETFEESIPLVLTSIATIPNIMNLESEETGQINIIGVYNNDFYNQVNNPDGTTFESDDELVATANSAGLVSFVGVGTATITATNGELTDTTTVICS